MLIVRDKLEDAEKNKSLFNMFVFLGKFKLFPWEQVGAALRFNGALSFIRFDDDHNVHDWEWGKYDK